MKILIVALEKGWTPEEVELAGESLCRNLGHAGGFDIAVREAVSDHDARAQTSGRRVLPWVAGQDIKGYAVHLVLQFAGDTSARCLAEGAIELRVSSDLPAPKKIDTLTAPLFPGLSVAARDFCVRASAVAHGNGVLLIAMMASCPSFHAERFWTAVQRLFPDSPNKAVLAPNERVAATFRAQCPEITVLEPSAALDDSSYGTWVYVTRQSWSKLPDLINMWDIGSRDAFVLNHSGAMARVDRATGQIALDEELAPHRTEHIYSTQASTKGFGGNYFTPYGTFCLRPRTTGPVSSFGHRVRDDFMELGDRDPNTIVIAVYGGSSAYSILCQYEESFTQLLEVRLNAHLETVGDRRRVVVLNFGQPGNLVLNQTITYLLFSQRIRPDVVISHTGINDLGSGLLNDPVLLSKYDFNYQLGQESWTLRFPGAKQENLRNPKTKPPLSFVAAPGVVVDACVHRFLQFAEVVRASGARFIAALQPFWTDKGQLSDQERELCELLLAERPASVEIYRRMERLYEILRGRGAHVYGTEHWIDFGPIFGERDENDTLFGDPVHLTPAGDEILAEHYFGMLKRILPSLGGRP